jgi:hypothetical protein
MDGPSARPPSRRGSASGRCASGLLASEPKTGRIAGSVLGAARRRELHGPGDGRGDLRTAAAALLRARARRSARAAVLDGRRGAQAWAGGQARPVGPAVPRSVRPYARPRGEAREPGSRARAPSMRAAPPQSSGRPTPIAPPFAVRGKETSADGAAFQRSTEQTSPTDWIHAAQSDAPAGRPRQADDLDVPALARSIANARPMIAASSCRGA